MSQDILTWATELEMLGQLDQSCFTHIMDLFIWGTDPYEPFHPEVLFNKNHLLGILACRSIPCVSDVTLSSNLQLTDITPANMTLKQVKDSLANLQFEWPHFLEKLDLLGPGGDHTDKVQLVRLYLQAIMHRVGILVSHALPDKVLNDIQDTFHCEPEDPPDLLRLTPAAIRRIMASILVLNRHMDLYDLSEEVVVSPLLEQENFKNGVTIYHHEASTEHFYKLHMYWSLPVSAKMQYKHDFPGMFNDISQVVYFHNPDYKRVKREDHLTTLPLHLLPSVVLLHPEVKIKFEDDLIDPLKPGTDWYWILLPQRVYLVSPEPKVYYARDLNLLLQVYINSKQS